MTGSLLSSPTPRTWILATTVGGLLALGGSARGGTDPADQERDTAMRQGVAFLVSDQNEDGSWGSARQTKGLNIYAPVPGAHHAFRSAVSAMCVAALIDSGLADQPGTPAAEALRHGEEFLLERLPVVRRATPQAIYNVWSHAYAVQALARMHAREKDGERRDRIVRLMNRQVERLERYESIDGGWGYYDFRARTARPASSSISFTTATVLVAFHEGREVEGFTVPDDLIERAVDSINRQRKSDHSYLYGEYLKARPMHPVNRPGGSLGRSQACNYALRVWGDESISPRIVDSWLNRLWERNGWLDIGRKRPIPHEAWFAVAGYFFYYGHYYAGLCLEIAPPEQRDEHAASLTRILVDLQESDGSWWDYPLFSYHQPYGTAFALMTLALCD